MVKTASGKNVLLKVVPQTSNIPKTYILKPANIVRSTSVLNADTLNDSTTGQEVITEEGGIKEVTDSVESGAKVEGQNEEPFLCENLFDSCTNGEVFINEIILEDNINEVVMEQNVNEVTIDNTTDSTVKEIVLDNMLHV
ncbi:uncharacterized protein LOC108914879 [Anoplophora glabripennis]|uniref:uncharacterized protein LOC108914879 n=1 Tax=Anoplophora glabripennis TaxID=217634 RepID=UPI00087385C9|nr:uncharacterized protein LOC108914879 [Anoplophora glabripennis]